MRKNQPGNEQRVRWGIREIHEKSVVSPWIDPSEGSPESPCDGVSSGTTWGGARRGIEVGPLPRGIDTSFRGVLLYTPMY